MFKLLFVVFVIAQFTIPAEILNQLLTWLMPLIIYGVTWAVTKAKPLIPGWAVIIVVALLGGLATLVAQLLASPELIWWQQLLYNLLAIVISQIKIQFSAEKRAEDQALKDNKIG